ncbi:Hydroxymethylpyrimidine pyrophosphatase [Micromonospora pallida]|uniref:Hydroxymethylpyrimidine pyrophosphatase n=1 Tax=Micromonospora pallida TaxID=145854 RepID=A0A1C6RU90_9ACTN|nr:HAD hydrolase family protein [Micromonospora pallida]SCL20776.1 Hydroxymethylpyrimidine pyrophosphatase [Micromonospora pallida]
MTISYAAFDLDGTLIDAADQPYDGVVAGLAMLRQRGVVPLIVSGRSARSFRNLRHLDELFAQLDDEVLLSDGNVVLDRHADLLSFPLTCPSPVLRRLSSDPGIDMVVECSGEFHATTKRAAAQFAMVYRVPRQQVPLTGHALSDVPCFTAVTVFRSTTPVPELLDGTDCEVMTIRPFEARVVRPRGTGKSTALVRHLRRRFGEPDLSRTLAVGDGAADAPMLAACAFGVATSDASPVAVEAATRHLSGGLAEFLSAFDPESMV